MYDMMSPVEIYLMTPTHWYQLVLIDNCWPWAWAQVQAWTVTCKIWYILRYACCSIATMHKQGPKWASGGTGPWGVTQWAYLATMVAWGRYTAYRGRGDALMQVSDQRQLKTRTILASTYGNTGIFIIFKRNNSESKGKWIPMLLLGYLSDLPPAMGA